MNETAEAQSPQRRRRGARASSLRLLCALRVSAVFVFFCALSAIAGDDAALARSKKSLESALAARDAVKVREALHEVASEGTDKAAKLLLQVAPAARELDVYPDLVEALSSFKAEPAVAYLAGEAKKNEDWTIRYLVVEALAGIDRDPARAALFAAFDDRHEGVACCAMRSAASHRLKPAVTPLIDRLEKLEKEKPEEHAKARKEAQRALESLTGQTFGGAGDWRRWWAENEARAEPPAKKEKGDGAADETVVTRVRDRGEGEYLERIAASDVVVVKGDSDECENVLDALQVPHTLLSREDAQKKLASLDPARVLLVYNCEGDENKALKGDEAKALAGFVDRGGYLFTSDWAINEELAPAIPGYISVAKEMANEFGVKIAPARGAEKSPLLRDVFPENPYARSQMTWLIDNRAYTFNCAPNKVFPLVESAELLAKGGVSPVVAATFRPGKGAVLHVLGHFKSQKDKSGDGFALQQLLINFIVEKQKTRPRPAGGKKK
jgi:hypothetical protein